MMASVFSPMQGEPGAEGERGPKGDKVCGRKSPTANGAAPWSKALGGGTTGGNPLWVSARPQEGGLGKSLPLLQPCACPHCRVRVAHGVSEGSLARRAGTVPR